MTDIPKTEAQLEAGLEVEKKETETSQSQELPFNVYRVYADKLESPDAEQYPKMLYKIMEEHEFTDCIKRIKEAYNQRIHGGAIIVIPFILFPVFIIVSILTKIYYLFILAGVDAIVFFVMAFTLERKNLAMINGRTKKLEEILKEINSTFYSRGVKWSYNIVQATEGPINVYIEIITFAPGAPDAPDSDAIFFAPSGYVIPGEIQSSGEPPKAYPAAPPEDAYPLAPMPDGAPTKEVADDDVDGPNPYESYPGDPSNL